MIGDGDAGVFFNPREFGSPGTFRPMDRPGQSWPIFGVFTASHVVANGDVSTTAPVLTVSAVGQEPRSPVKGDGIEIGGVPYRVADPQPDGSGLVRLILERA